MDFLDKILNTGLAGYQAYTNAETVKATGPAKTVTAQPTQSTWMPYAIVGGVVVVLVGLVMAFRR